MIELIIAVVIIGVIAGFVLPKLTLSIERNKLAEAIGILSALRSAQVVYEFENGAYATNISALDVEIPTSEHYDNIQVQNGNPVATVDRSQTNQSQYDYDMGITDDGDICCNSIDPVNICNLLGYTQTCP